jgi:cyclophilin family peptidyl-prolyl cis-trans isomerase
MAAASSGASSWSGTPWTTEAAAIDLELARDAAGAAALVGESDAAARTLARIGGADAAAQLLATIERGDRQPSAAELAAIGLLEPLPGLPGEPREPDGVWQTLERDLWTRYAVDDDASRMRALTFSLARIGGSYSQAMWAIELAESDANAERRAAVLEAMGIACARRHRLHEHALPQLATIVEGEVSAIRAAAIYALARCVAPSAESFAGPHRAAWVQRLAAVLADDHPEEAALAWKALAGLGEVPAVIPAAILAASAPAPAIEVEAVRALAGHADGRTAILERLVRLDPAQLHGARVNVVWTALQALRKPIDAAPELFDPLRTWHARLDAITAQDERQSTELAIMRCELLALQAIVDGRRDPLLHCAEGIAGVPEHYAAVLAVEVATVSTRALPGSARVDALLAHADDARAAVAEAALSALADLDDPRVSARLREALAGDDVGVLAAAAGAIAARAADRDKRDAEAVGALEAMLARVDRESAIEARLSAIEALGALARSAATDTEGQAWLARTVVPLASDPNDAIRRAAWTALHGHDDLRAAFSVPASFPEGFAAPVHAAVKEPPAAGLRVRTALGDIVIAFEGAPAPIAQANLVALARAGRFDGLRFHRVVPGFVVQGGDPRGDGYGGPGFVLPCEWSDLRYERGTVGMALAGKDTGGSQFFVAQSRQPHLDGRFTVIGRVVEGLELVDRILPHERIERVLVEETRP